MMGSIFVGIDVGQRKCAICLLDSEGEVRETGWAQADEAAALVDRTCERLGQMVEECSDVRIGIDAPRQARPEPRRWYWNSRKADWRKRRSSDKGNGRHCEVVVAALRLANPQWTPVRKQAPEWMNVGFGLFDRLEKLGETYEVFPSAS